MPKAIVLHEYGDAEVLRLAEVQVRAPGPGEILIRQTAIGVHFHDIYVRSGLYKTLDLPGTPGLEAAGVVEAVGPGAAAFKIGDRIVYVTSGYGAYATHRVLPGEWAVKIPDTLSDALVATNFSRLLTVQMLIDKVTALRPEHTILVTAASGGVGRLLCQAARAAGARVIGSVSTPEKAARARDYGCAHALTYDQDDFAEEIHDLTQGNGVDIVYDSVGAKTFQSSLAALRLRGHLVNFGQSSGAVDPVALSALAAKSLSITRPILFHYINDPAEYQAMSAAAFATFDAGRLVLPDLEGVDLANAAAAHRRLETGQGGGSLYLTP